MKVGIFSNFTTNVYHFEEYAAKYNGLLELVPLNVDPGMDVIPVVKAAGCEALIYYNPILMPPEFFRGLAEAGVKYLSSTSAGYDHYDLKTMKEVGLKGSNVPAYSPNAIAEDTVLLTLSLLRHFREQIERIDACEYGIGGLMGREVRNMKIGVVGAGRIGRTTIKCLSGFGPKKIYACDLYENDEVKQYAEYADIDTIYKECDIIIYHTVLNEQNFHMVNADTIAKMKDGVLLVNPARGGLFDTEAVLAAVESGKIGGLAIDVIEQEEDLTPGLKSCPLPLLEKLLTHKNVLFTRHTAFFTDEAARNMGESCIDHLASYATTGTSPTELVK